MCFISQLIYLYCPAKLKSNIALDVLQLRSCLNWSEHSLSYNNCDYSLLLLLTSSQFTFPPFQNKNSNQKIKTLVQDSGSSLTIQTELGTTLETDIILLEVAISRTQPNSLLG